MEWINGIDKLQAIYRSARALSLDWNTVKGHHRRRLLDHAKTEQFQASGRIRSKLEREFGSTPCLNLLRAYCVAAGAPQWLTDSIVETTGRMGYVNDHYGCGCSYKQTPRLKTLFEKGLDQ